METTEPCRRFSDEHVHTRARVRARPPARHYTSDSAARACIHKVAKRLALVAGILLSGAAVQRRGAAGVCVT